MARPSSFTAKTGDTICARLAAGESLRGICRDDAMPDASTVFRWLSGSDETLTSFREQYTRAREIQAHAFVDEIFEISDDGSNDWMARQGKDDAPGWTLNGEHIQRSRLRVDSRKWFASKVLPKIYGDRVIQEVTGKDGGPIQTEEVNARELIASRIAGIASRLTPKETPSGS